MSADIFESQDRQFDELLSRIKMTCVHLLKNLHSRRHVMADFAQLQADLKTNVNCDGGRETCYHNILVPSVVYPMRIVLRQQAGDETSVCVGVANSSVVCFNFK